MDIELLDRLFYCFLILLIFVPVTFLIFRNRRKILFKNRVVVYKKNKYIDVHGDRLIHFNIYNYDAFKDELFDIFCKFENAYNDLDYRIMKSCASKQLYDDYFNESIINKKTGLKRYINNIKRKDMVIYELASTSAKQTVSAMIKISYTNYMMNGDGLIVKGSRNSITEAFEVTYRKDFNDVSTNCPNCGAPISGGVCEFCNKPVEGYNFKICKIKKIVKK